MTSAPTGARLLLMTRVTPSGTSTASPSVGNPAGQEAGSSQLSAYT